MQKSIIILGCFDTKSAEFSYLYDCLRDLKQEIITINTGVMETKVPFPIHITAEEVAGKSRSILEFLQQKSDRGFAVEVMGSGAARIIGKLFARGNIHGVIGMGGGGGTFIALAAMQTIPLGVPKFLVSTMAGKDLSRQMGTKDITIMPAIVDVAGLNSIDKRLIKQAAAAIAAMAKVEFKQETNKKKVAITMFGNTTACVQRCTEMLTDTGYEVFTFHANGIGGRMMESLISEHCFDAVLDITTTELADELCGGVCSAGPERLTAASRLGIPQVIVPGCLDMVNFSQPDTIPGKYQNRKFYGWAPDVTLMRTNAEENSTLGEQLVTKVKHSTAPVTIYLPLKGISEIDREGGIFFRPEIDQILFNAIKKTAGKGISVKECSAHINDTSFAEKLVEELLSMIKR